MGASRVGMIGYNDGNGHPYSFSAIINGYDAGHMAVSPYPVIAEYLSKRSEDEFGIEDLRVTHLWTPDRQVSADIARCTFIENVTGDYREMTEDIDAVIIARDDADSHRELASWFLERGKTVFVDKPLCSNMEDLNYFYPWLKQGKLMSCSGFRYYPEILGLVGRQGDSPEIVFSHSVSIIDWFKYGIHVLEGITPVMGNDVEWVQETGEPGNRIVRIQYKSGNYSLIQVSSDLGFVLESSFYTRGDKHYKISYDDNFSCFKRLLKAFYRQYKTGQPAIDPEETVTIIKILLAAEKSLEVNNKKVELNAIR